MAWLRPTRRVRDVSGLSGSEAAVTQEVVDTSGGPLKPAHRRLALRDPRLLPKPKASIQSYGWRRPRKSNLFPAQEAKRLFSDTMRTRDRNVRDLATDEEQLSRYGLPVWHGEADIAAALGISTTQLRHYSIHRQRETTPHYVAFAIVKRTGGRRVIYAPKKRLKALQRRLDALLVSKLPVSQHAHGFRPGRSVASNAEQHVGKAVVIKLDLQDCFPSIHFGRVRGLLISLGYSYPVATSLAVLMTEAPRQPVEVEGKIYHVPVGPRVCVQGAPTSPGLCNAVLMRLDRRLAGLAHKHGFHYTRYADDLTLSGHDISHVKLLVSIAAKIARDEGFRLNRNKTRVLHQGRRQHVTGVIVNQQMGLSRVQRRRLRAAIHQLAADDQRQRKRLEGKIAYLKMLNPQQAQPLQQAFQAALNR
jgi:retron-type reverse transcriptase